MERRVTWNYRIGFKRHKIPLVSGDNHEATGEYHEATGEYHEELEYGIVEAYYDDAGRIKFTTENFKTPYGETKEDLVECLQMMLKDALKHPDIDLEALWDELKDKQIED